MKGQGLGEGPKTNEAVTGAPPGQSLAPSGPKAGPEGEHGSWLSVECGSEMLSAQFRRQGPLPTLHTQTGIHTFLGNLGPQGMRVLAFYVRKAAVSVSRL